MRCVIRAALAASALLLAGAARAETPPSVWDRAKAPEVADEYQLHLTAQRIFAEQDLRRASSATAMFLDAQLMRVLAMLQSAGAEKSKNPLLRFDLAEAYSELKQYSRAVAIYKGAMADFPTHTLTRHSRFQLAIACGHVGDHECESRMYREIIAHGTAPQEIATPTLNLAETDMHAHELKEAIEGYREALRLCGSYQAGDRTPALVLWGLAVALDRAGEVHEADETAARALSMARNNLHALHDEDVFFFPEYEVLWYDALTYAAAARREQKPKERLELWLRAERFMTAWITGAERAKEKDYWLPVARTRLATYAKERKQAEAAALKLPAAAEPEEAFTLTPPRAPVTPLPKIKPPPPIPKSGDVRL
ncbi:MAG: tetratricopeptide repeat protein [Labilithrix sp.]